MNGKIFEEEKQYKINVITKQALNMKFIQFKPIYKERIWGGRRLEEGLRRKLPDARLYGESWEIVDRDEDQSIVANGQWQGLSLRELLNKEGSFIMGPGWKKDKRFPILVKWLDCRERLSLQVHPPKKVAATLGGESKTENWYIAEGDAGANVFAGVRRGVTPEIFLKAVQKGDLEALLCEVKVEKGDSLFIPSGRLHAIGGGCLILEIQENSDTTYRVYDWGRLGPDGKPRAMHLKESMESIDFEDIEPSKKVPVEGTCILADCEEFRIRRVEIGSEAIEIKGGEEPRIISVVEGELKISDRDGQEYLSKGSNVLLPYREEFVLEAVGVCIVLITDRFGL